jgi:hypothetical protein
MRAKAQHNGDVLMVFEIKVGILSKPLEIKSGPPWRVQFWPLHCGKSFEALISS